MYIYHALINTLSVHTTHINLNTIFYTHVQRSPTETIYISYYMETHSHTHTHTHTHKQTRARARTDTRTHNVYSRNWVLILVDVEIL